MNEKTLLTQRSHHFFGGALLLLFCLFFLLPSSTHAEIYAPGETLSPACGPADANCGVVAPVFTADTLTNGALLYASSTDWVILSAGGDGEVLKISGGVPTWGADDGGASYSAGNGLELTGANAFALDLTNPNTWAALQTFNAGFSLGGNTYTDLSGDGLDFASGVLSATLGTNVDVSGETNLTVGTGATLTGDTLSVDLGTSIDVSDETNLAAGSGATLTGDTLSVALGTVITSAEITDNTIANADIAVGAVENENIVDDTLTFAKLASNSCATGEVPKYNGTDWTCGADFNNKYTAGTALDLSSGVFSLDIDGLTETTAINGADTLALYDQSAGEIRKITRTNLFSGITGALTYQGTWDASANSPMLSDSGGTKGHYYVVTIGGTVDLGSGALTFNVGDRVIHNGSAWQKLDASDSVTNVFGRTGTIVASAGDYNAVQITFTPSGGIVASNVAGALEELDSEMLGGSLTTGLVFVGNSSNEAAAVALSGDVTLASDGTVTIENNATTLGTDTTGDYVATIADSGNGIFDISNSGTENAAVTLGLATDALDFTYLADTLTLDADTTVTQGGKSFTFIGNGAGTTFGPNGRVGIGTVNPASSLDVDGTATVNRLTIDGAFSLPTTDGAAGQVLTSDGAGTLTWKTLASTTDTTLYSTDGTLAEDRTIALAGNSLVLDGTGNDIVFTGSGNLGIGTTTPGYDLSVAGDINFTGDLYQDGVLFSGGSQTLAGLTDVDTTGASAGSLLYFDGTDWQQLSEGQSGEVLTTDGSGALSWTTVSAPTGAGSVDYLLAGLSNIDTSNVGDNSTPTFDEIVASRGTSISLNQSTGRFTLAAGKTYRLTGYIAPSSSDFLGFTWYNVTNGNALGVRGASFAATSQDSNVNSAEAIAIISPTVETVVELRHTGGVTSKYYPGNSNLAGTRALIEEVPSGSSGSGGSGANDGNGILSGGALVLESSAAIDMDTNTAGINFDSGTLVIDSVNNRLGIGTVNPASSLDVDGIATVNGLTIDGAFTLPTADGSAGQVLTTDGSGALSWINPGAAPWSLSGTDTYYTDGNVGIGDTSPDYSLDVAGSIYATNDLRAGDDLYVSDDLYGSSDASFDGHVGIGTGAASNYELYIAGYSGGDITATIRNTYSGGNAGLRLTTTDGTSDIYREAGNDLLHIGDGVVVEDGGGVGIGTTNPANDVVLEVEDSGKSILVDQPGSESPFCYVGPSTGGLNVACGSDRRLKKEIVDTETNALEFFNGIRVRDFTWRSSGDRLTGVIAQELRETHPEMVSDEYGEYLTVETPNPWLLVKAIQELNAKESGLDFVQPEDFVEPKENSFVGRLLAGLRGWFADSANGITEFFADEVHTDELCLSTSDGQTVCVTGDEMQELLQEKASSQNESDINTNDSEDEDLGNEDGTLNDGNENVGENENKDAGGDTASSTDKAKEKATSTDVTDPTQTDETQNPNETDGEQGGQEGEASGDSESNESGETQPEEPQAKTGSVDNDSGPSTDQPDDPNAQEKPAEEVTGNESTDQSADKQNNV